MDDIKPENSAEPIFRTNLNVWMMFLCINLIGCGPHPQLNQVSEQWGDVDNPNLVGVESQNYLSLASEGRLAPSEKTWSGSYWPTFRGGISQRWQSEIIGIDHRAYQYDVLTSEQVLALSETDLNLLSPSEKWDLVHHRMRFPLTRMQKQLTETLARMGPIPRWRGLCHGWAAASALVPIPAHPVTVALPYNNITFSPQDISALLSDLYGQQQFTATVVGTRCTSREPVRDENGRPIFSECLDLNPASLHLILSSSFSSEEFPLIADFDAGNEIWNYPITGYSFEYSHLRPLTRDDPLYVYRSPLATDIVDVNLSIFTPVSTRETVLPQLDLEAAHEFVYSLELDSNGLIVGGEWESDRKIDFLWRIEENISGSSNPFLNAEAVLSLAAQSQN